MNENGESLLAFIEANDLRIVNDQEKSGKVFTREQRKKGSVEFRSRSCLDLCLVGNSILESSHELGGFGGDHEEGF